jgi:hypothetical protein
MKINAKKYKSKKKKMKAKQNKCKAKKANSNVPAVGRSMGML